MSPNSPAEAVSSGPDATTRTASSVAPASPAAVPVKSGFMISPLIDSIFIIGSPLLALVLAVPLFAMPKAWFDLPLAGETRDLRMVFATVFTAAHLVLVFVRSHANQNVFRMFPWRFTLVPAALVVAMGCSVWLSAVLAALGVWWDVWHSSLQTFGFGRIYDSRKRNDPYAGRELDFWMNLLVYLGPVLAGAHFMDHLTSSLMGFNSLREGENPLRTFLLDQTPAYLNANQGYLVWGIVIAGSLYTAYYFHAYHQLTRRGYQVSWQKVWLYAITAAVSIYTWGFRSFLDAFWVMNVFHALQYFVIVLHAEGGNLRHLFRVEHLPLGNWIAACYIVVLCTLYGLWAGYFAAGTWMIGATTTVSLMHFWYDSFIWSVRKKQV